MTDKEAIEVLLKEVDGIPSDVWDEGCEKFENAVKRAVQALENERPQATWIRQRADKTHYNYFCSECGCKSEFRKGNYCPNCGAKMGESK